jgi:hypothetical protein
MHPTFGLRPGQFMIKTYLTGNLMTARDGGGHSGDALTLPQRTSAPNERFQLTTSQPSLTSITT